MRGKEKIAGMATGGLLLVVIVAWIFTAPYPGNTGWQRMPGIILGGTDTPAPSDFTTLGRGRMMMKQAGFPPLVVYLTYATTPEGIVSATRPDGGYWARRAREGTGDGWLRIGDQTYAMRATEVTGDDRFPMLELYGGRPLDMESTGFQPLRDWEVFVWTPR